MIEKDTKPYGVIYFVLNTQNGKYYVGQTIRSIENRWYNHVWRSLRKVDSLYFHNAIKYYGIQNFEIRTLLTLYSKEDLDAAEKYYIDFLQSRNSDIGYNSSEGGSNGSPNKDTRRKQSIAKLGREVPVESLIKEYKKGFSTVDLANKFGINKSTARRILIKEGIILRSKEETSNKGKKHRKDLLDEDVIQDYLSGMSSVKIAEKYKTSTSTVIQRLKKAGIQRRSLKEATKKKNIDIKTFEDDYINKGYTYKVLSRKHGISEVTVNILINKLNLPKRHHRV